MYHVRLLTMDGRTQSMCALRIPGYFNGLRIMDERAKRGHGVSWLPHTYSSVE
jgi:hypothetical protein